VALIAPGCSPSNSAGAFAGADDAGATGSGSSGGDGAAGTASGEGGADDGSGGTTVSGSSGGGSSSGMSFSSSGTVAHDASSGDAHGSDAASTSNTDGGDPLNSIRQACVDRINMHRATLSNLSPLARASATTEACSDRGAMSDATSNMAHASAGMCPGTGAQDTCPSLPVGGGATLLSSLNQCLDQMWAEGPPPAGTTVAQCIQNYTGCFLQHGHWINMSDSYMPHTAVSCGFYQMSNGYHWGNQDFL
jgi:hypothetical protein